MREQGEEELFLDKLVWREIVTLTQLTFLKVLCPPNSNWRENVQTAIDCDAAAIIVDVLKLHPGNEDVLDRCANSLGHLCFDQATAEQIADQVGLLLFC